VVTKILTLKTLLNKFMLYKLYGKKVIILATRK